MEIQSKINSFILQEELKLSLISESNFLTQWLPKLLVTTMELKNLFFYLVSHNLVIVNSDSRTEIIFKKNKSSPSIYWEIAFLSYSIEILRVILRVLLQQQNFLLFKGSIEDCFNLRGSFINPGIIKVESTSIDMLIGNLMKCTKDETLFDIPPLSTIPQPAKKTETIKESVTDDFIEISIKLNSTQVTKILGHQGQLIKSIRI
ncbi:hypothetical protein KGF54_000114 [Candida jiufengensis]|uniref:uncharacterized protein n=1 Tax=Candida jiufengensis TaxID=497108 RepID=UPI0022251226|nr:uncharacterized protein KGF54_000114 [Candida jiufengensis]KAI5957186.1 hypothetical protein KGF54_000114 [Candida jiufengensis]